MIFSLANATQIIPAALWWGVLAFAIAEPATQTTELRWAGAIIAVCGVLTVMFQYLHALSQGKTNVRLREIDLGIKQLDDNEVKRSQESAERERATAKKVQEVKENLCENSEKLAAKTDTLAKEDTLNKLHENSASESRKLDDLAKVSQATHEFLNSERGVTLKEKAVDKRQIAKLTGDSRDAEIAEQAEDAFHRHNDAQKRVNAQTGTDAQKTGHAGVAEPAKLSSACEDLLYGMTGE